MPATAPRRWEAYDHGMHQLIVACRGGAITLLVATALADAALAASRTVVLRQGQAGFTGVTDTFISRLDWDTPPQHTMSYGLSDSLMLSRDGGENPVLRFDLSAVPANSTVIAATLALYNRTSSGGVARQVEAFRMLEAWDEGNQAASPIDAPGKHGATGDNAFDYYPGEGTDVPWGARGMQAGLDYAEAVLAKASIDGVGWVTWDLSSLVRAWVRGEAANLGVVLRDASGWADNNPDWRELVSSQSSDAELRPTLTVTYDPDTPWANAGPDRSTYAWDHGALTLDGTASHDRPGGRDTTLRYLWRVARAAYGSALAGTVVGSSRIASFTPDAAGEWEIELTLTNDMAASATDSVHLRVLSIPPAHPRLYLTPTKLAALRERARDSNPRWTAVKDEADDPEGEMHAKALVGVITGQASYCDAALALALTQAADPDNYSGKAGNVALVYDWCHDRLSSAQQATLIAYLNASCDTDHQDDNDTPGWGNYWPRWTSSYALAGIASHGENPRATEWLDEYRSARIANLQTPLLDRIADGGAWPEGTVYDWIANVARVKAMEAWRSGTGEDLFRSSRWFGERLGFLLLRHVPGTAEQWGRDYHPYPSNGDGERNRGTMVNYERIMGLILIERFSDDPLARQLQAYLATPPADTSYAFEAHDEMLFFNPEQPSLPPTLLAHLAAGTGTVLLRSGWPSGAADTDAWATHLTFQCGDHFTYHQHYDQNAFTLQKGADLLVDAGVYSGDGLSYHDQNYYVRTVAHNTLLVQNPAESFDGARPDAESNDGGQRPPYPASRSPQTVAYWDEHATHYETGNIRRFENVPAFAYVLGDATAAYNNPAYNQAMDTGLSGNVAKLTRFLRELVYLRPAPGSQADYLVLLDRVGVARDSFSGANTKLLFHTMGQPTVDGTATQVSEGETLYDNATLAVADHGQARVFLSFLQPAARRLRSVGGRGAKAFWVDGANYDWHWSADEPQPRPTNDFEEVPYGEWRLELEAADSTLDHTFLTVIEPTTARSGMPTPTRLVTGNGLVGAEIGDPMLPRVAVLSSAVDGAPPSGTLAYTVRATRAAHTVFDLAPASRFRLTATPVAGGIRITLTPDLAGALVASSQGVLAFTVGPPEPRVRRHLGR